LFETVYKHDLLSTFLDDLERSNLKNRMYVLPLTVHLFFSLTSKQVIAVIIRLIMPFFKIYVKHNHIWVKNVKNGKILLKTRKFGKTLKRILDPPLFHCPIYITMLFFWQSIDSSPFNFPS